jgi:hypothetical protein
VGWIFRTLREKGALPPVDLHSRSG